MTKQQIALARLEAELQIEASIKEISNKLDVACLDGSPFMVVIEHEGIERVYGEWPSMNGDGTKIRGFLGADAVPNHLCGSIQFTPEGAQAFAAQLNGRGEKAHYTHWRAFLQNRLTGLLKLQETLQAA